MENLKQELHKLAIGYEVSETVATFNKDGKPIRIRKYKKHVPSSLSALLEYRRLYGSE